MYEPDGPPLTCSAPTAGAEETGAEEARDDEAADEAEQPAGRQDRTRDGARGAEPPQPPEELVTIHAPMLTREHYKPISRR
jgi:hypothetical protein